MCVHKNAYLFRIELLLFFLNLSSNLKNEKKNRCGSARCFRITAKIADKIPQNMAKMCPIAAKT